MENMETKDMSNATKANNYTMFDLLRKYTKDEQIRFFLAIINRIETKYYGADNSNYEAHKALNDGTVIDKIDMELDAIDIIDEVTIPMSFLQSIKGGKKYIKKDIVKLMKSVYEPIQYIDECGRIDIIAPFKRITYDPNKESFNVVINEEAIQYLITIKSNFSWLDLETMRTLRGKFDFGIYFIYRRYYKLKSKRYSLDEIKELIGSNETDNSNLKRMIEKSVDKINVREKKKMNIEWETAARGKLTGIKFIFI